MIQLQIGEQLARVIHLLHHPPNSLRVLLVVLVPVSDFRPVSVIDDTSLNCVNGHLNESGHSIVSVVLGGLIATFWGLV